MCQLFFFFFTNNYVVHPRLSHPNNTVGPKTGLSYEVLLFFIAHRLCLMFVHVPPTGLPQTPACLFSYPLPDQRESCVAPEELLLQSPSPDPPVKLCPPVISVGHVPSARWTTKCMWSSFCVVISLCKSYDERHIIVVILLQDPGLLCFRLQVVHMLAHGVTCQARSYPPGHSVFIC